MKLLLTGVTLGLCAHAQAQLRFTDATDEAGLGGLSSSRVTLVDVNGDGRPDAVIRVEDESPAEDDTQSPRKVERYRIFLNAPAETGEGEGGLAFAFTELGTDPGLPVFDPKEGGGICVFADLDNDGNADAVFARYLDVNRDGYAPPTIGPPRTCWMRGNGDGTFGRPVGSWHVIESAPPKTTAAIAVGDINRDGRLDLYLGNWYKAYGQNLEGFCNDVLFQVPAGADGPEATPRFERQTFDEDYEDIEPFDEELDGAGRPTYGVMIVDLYGPPLFGMAGLLELNYGRRWNRYWEFGSFRNRGWTDIALVLKLGGDAVTHGRYPDWLKERGRTDPRFDREDEKPFRANGNTFDAAVGDINNDGRFDLFLAEIAHGWAGESSDRSRFLVQTPPRPVPPNIDLDPPPPATFEEDARLSVDRLPADPTVHSWNQGDLYAELADFDLDGRLDLLLCSSDYPDNQRARIYRQQPDGTFRDITSWVGIDHEGAQRPSIGDVDGDGDLDILIGQSFFRYDRTKINGRTPRVRLFLNQAVESGLGNWLELRLVGDPARGLNLDALGAVVVVTARIRGETVTQSRQLIGIGGHQGKQHEFILHFGLGDANVAESVVVCWPGEDALETRLTNVPAGLHTVRSDDDQ